MTLDEQLNEQLNDLIRMKERFSLHCGKYKFYKLCKDSVLLCSRLESLIFFKNILDYQFLFGYLIGLSECGRVSKKDYEIYLDELLSILNSKD